MENRNIRSHVSWCVSERDKVTFFSTIFAPLEGGVWIFLLFFFQIRLKILCPLSGLFQLYQKHIFRAVSGFLSFSGSLLADMGVLEGTVLDL